MAKPEISTMTKELAPLGATPMTKDMVVRAAAKQLGAAIAEAEGAGYRVTWPASAAGLAAIGVSETGRVAQPEPELRQLAELPVADPVPEPDPTPQPGTDSDPGMPARRARRG